MAKISFETAQEFATQNSTTNATDVKFFSLKNDGDTAVVRIMHDSVEDFDILTTHTVTIDGKQRKVSCIRGKDEPIDNCPLCAKEGRFSARIFIHMIQYISNPDGTVTAQPVIWERGSDTYAPKLRNLITEYGPLSENVFKIRRNGRAGDASTTYDILFGSPAVYQEQTYIKMPNAFDKYSVLGTVVLDKKYPEIVEYVNTGSFPKTADSATTATATVNVEPVVTTPGRPARYY